RRDDRGRDPRPAAPDPRARRARTPYWTRRGRDRAVLPSRGPIRLRAGTPATRMVGPRRPSEGPRRPLRRLDGADEAHLIPTTVLAVPSGNLVTQFAVARFTQGSLLSPSSRCGSSARGTSPAPLESLRRRRCGSR